MKELGLNAVDNMSIEDRIDAQEKLLEQYLKEIAALPRPFITDRSPLDMIGYMFGEITMHNTNKEIGDRAISYMEKCLRAAANNFDTIFFVRPLNVYEVDSSKPPLNNAYQWEIQFIIEGTANLINDYVSFAILQTTDLKGRVKSSSEMIINRIMQMREDRQSAMLQ
jgi:hypothetical protein